MSRKKVVIVIVEGGTDEACISLILSKLDKNTEFHFSVAHGDITADYKSSQSNIRSRINDIVKNEKSIYKYKTKDIIGVLHIVDTDGAFISDDNIVEDSKYDKAFYDNNIIRISDRRKIIERNALKSSILCKLIATHDINEIPYGVFFMSANLDHVLHGKANCSDAEKVRNALNFKKSNKDRIFEFINYLETAGIGMKCGYRESWAYIQSDTNSLQRYTNITIFLSELCKEGNTFERL